MLPKVGIFLPKYVRVVSLLFICIRYCEFGWFNKQVHSSEMHRLDNFKIFSIFLLSLIYVMVCIYP